MNIHRNASNWRFAISSVVAISVLGACLIYTAAKPKPPGFLESYKAAMAYLESQEKLGRPIAAEDFLAKKYLFLPAGAIMESPPPRIIATSGGDLRLDYIIASGKDLFALDEFAYLVKSKRSFTWSEENAQRQDEAIQTLITHPWKFDTISLIEIAKNTSYNESEYYDPGEAWHDSQNLIIAAIGENKNDAEATRRGLVVLHRIHASWNDYACGDGEIYYRLQTQIDLAKASAQFLNHGGSLADLNTLTTLSELTANWKPFTGWGHALLYRRDIFLAAFWGKRMELPVEYANIANAKRWFATLYAAVTRGSQILERAAMIIEEPWTEKTVGESISQIKQETESARSDCPYPFTRPAWDIIELANPDYDVIEIHQEWKRELARYQLFLAAQLHHANTGKFPKTVNDLPNIKNTEAISKEIGTSDISFVTWKWNFGEKLAIKFTLPDGKTAFWPEAPPK